MKSGPAAQPASASAMTITEILSGSLQCNVVVFIFLPARFFPAP
ncbi:hypothetical protein CPter91_1968 [Collimonas pratensis]|uniref:Uncharacterized protein n=1 Tax=Collimonas pratensis TaxID=279113 RepID=A0A127Q2T6_9BURK|nr:hypothetical protein CPter91_1968 [Collimonas pratensis]